EIHLEESRPGLDLSGNQSLRQRILHIALQGTAQWTRTIAAITKGLVENPLLGLLGDRDGDRLLRQVRVELLHKQFDNLDQVGVRQGQEENDLVQPVEELRIEG